MDNTPDVSWDSLGLSEDALQLIRKAGFDKPTPVQAQAIPLALKGHDVVASAQTGTGKTASFVLPMVEKFAGREGTYGVILCPTREIAQQTQQTLELFGTPRGVRSIVLIGGVNMRADALALDTYPQIIVATPGRLCDHLDRGNVWLDYVEVVVLDEADRMLDMGFADQLNRIMEEIPEDRQTLLFSATIPPAVDRLAKKILYKPESVAIGRTSSAATSVEQRLIRVQEEDKNRELRKLLREESGTIIVFTRTKDGATKVWRSLHSAGVYDATYIHSDRLQSHREQALAEFKEGKFRVLIATDVAGRGIHVDNVAHVVNYDLPYEPEDYVHRIGRTGRAGQTGRATSFVTPRDRRLLEQIERLIGKPIPIEGGGGGGSRGDGEEDRGGHSDRHRERRPRGAHPEEKRRHEHGSRHEKTGPKPEKHDKHAQSADKAPPATGAHPAPTTGEVKEGAEGAAPKRRRRRRGGRGRRGGGGGGGGTSGPQGPATQ